MIRKHPKGRFTFINARNVMRAEAWPGFVKITFTDGSVMEIDIPASDPEGHRVLLERLDDEAAGDVEGHLCDISETLTEFHNAFAKDPTP